MEMSQRENLTPLSLRSRVHCQQKNTKRLRIEVERIVYRKPFTRLLLPSKLDLRFRRNLPVRHFSGNPPSGLADRCAAHQALDPSRHPQEKRGIPVFKGGCKTAAGRFEAEFVDASGQPEGVHEDPEFIRNAFNPQADVERAREEGRGAYAAPITISVPQQSSMISPIVLF